MTTPNVFVHVSPKPGKEARIAELGDYVLEQVKAHEPWVSMYRVYSAKSLEGDLVHYFIEFRIDDMSKLSTRKDLPHHKTLARAFEDEDLLRAPLSYCVLEDKGGWTR